MMNVTQLMLGINIVVAVVEIAIRLQGKSVAARWRMNTQNRGLAHPHHQGDLKHLHNNALDIAPDPDIEYLIQEIAKLP